MVAHIYLPFFRALHRREKETKEPFVCCVAIESSNLVDIIASFALRRSRAKHPWPGNVPYQRQGGSAGG